MSDFLDFDLLKNAVDEAVNDARHHPLIELKIGVKNAYVGGLFFACYADDNILQNEERNFVTGVAHSLGLNNEMIEDVAGTVLGLNDKIAYLKETVAVLGDRGTILFFLCDMIKAASADSKLNDRVLKLIDAITRLAGLDERDLSIVHGYNKVFSMKADYVKDINLGDVSSPGVEKELFEWHIPIQDQPVIRLKMRDFRGQIFNELIMSSFKRITEIGCEKIRFFDGIPKCEKRTAHKSLKVEESIHIVQIKIGIGPFRTGLVITNRALYFRNNVISDPTRLVWHDVSECILKGDTLCFGDGRRFPCLIGDSQSVKGFHKVLSDFIEAIHRDPSVLDFEWSGKSE